MRTGHSSIKNFLWFPLAEGQRREPCKFLCRKPGPSALRSCPPLQPFFFFSGNTSFKHLLSTLNFLPPANLLTLSFLCALLSALNGFFFLEKLYLIFKLELKLPPHSYPPLLSWPTSTNPFSSGFSSLLSQYVSLSSQSPVLWPPYNPETLHIGLLTPSVVVSEGWVFQRWLGHEGEVLVNGISAHLKEVAQSTLDPPTM